MKRNIIIYLCFIVCLNAFAKNRELFTENKSENNLKVEQNADKTKLIYLSEERLYKAKTLIIKNDPFFTEAYKYLLVEANKYLLKTPDPVTNKSQTPPSGDKHDFLSIAPYRWPNPATADGFPWILKDGEINPMYNSSDTDASRLNEMFASLDNLTIAFYFSDNKKYANKAREILQVWFIDANTKVNPNINYGQAIPGEVDGRRAGMITWSKFSTVINAIQILSSKNIINKKELNTLNTWILDYYTWLKTNKMGIENDNGNQNHSTSYDYQMVGIARYLGLNLEAKDRLEAFKTKRIEVQLDTEGKQPYELGRTKSVHYCSMNLRLMTFIAEMGLPLGVDLWNYSTASGKSIKKAYDFLRPFAEGTKEWPYKQITEGGIDKAIEAELIPVFCIASTIFNEALIDKKGKTGDYLTYLDKLKYPPLSYLK